MASWATVLAVFVAMIAPARSGETARLSSLPVLLTHVKVVDASRSSNSLCGSRRLARTLERWAFRWTAGPGDPPLSWVDFELRCEAERDKAAFRFVRPGREKPIRTVTLRRETAREADDLTMEVLAHHLARDRRVTDAALEELLRTNGQVYARHAAARREQARWAEAAEDFFFALESDLDPAPIYYGLYEAYARLGSGELALWHYLSYLRAAGKDPVHAEDKDIALLAPLLVEDVARFGKRVGTSGPYAEWERAVAAGNWHNALLDLRNVLRTAPWSLDLYDSLIDSYEKLEWEPLRGHWKKRRAFARRVARDRRTHRRLMGVLSR